MSAPTRPATQTPTSARPPLWRRPAVLVVAGVLVVLGIVVLTLFQPQRLLFDVTVDDDFPEVETDAAPAPREDADPDGEDVAPDVGDADGEQTQPDPAERPAGAEPATADEGGEGDEETVVEATGPVALSTGTFASRNRYTTAGTATAFELPDGGRTLRLEDFETTNGPDLFVYLTAADAEASDPELDADFINLGDLRGNIGNQNYDLPDEVDLDRYDTVVIWCRRFSVSFGVADLT